MKVWIEVSSEYRFDKKLLGESGLYAPSMTRYINMLKQIEKGDVILHYITKHGVKNKEYESSVIGISKASSTMNINISRLTVDLREIKILPVPINRKELFDLDKKSSKLKKILGVNFQRYLTEISMEDLRGILEIHPENLEFILKSKSYGNYFEE